MSAATTLRFTGNIRRLRLRPGDTIVVESTESITPELVGLLRDQMRAQYPDNPLIVMANGLRVAGVLRPEDTA